MGALIERGWWRRNAIPLVAMLVSAAAAVVVGVVIPLRSDVPSAPRRIAAAEDVRISGATFELTKAGVFRAGLKGGVDVPKGSMILAVIIRIRSSEKLPAYCSVTLARDGTDKIVWRPLDSPAQYRYGLSDSTDHVCELDDSSGTRLLEQTFLVPDDVYRHVTVRVEVTGKKGGDSSTVALELPAKPYSPTAAG